MTETSSSDVGASFSSSEGEEKECELQGDINGEGGVLAEIEEEKERGVQGDSVNRGEGGVFAEIGESGVVGLLVVGVGSERDINGGVRVNRSREGGGGE